MRTHAIRCLAAPLLVLALLSAPSRAETGFGLSNLTTVDTRGTGALTVIGRVMDRGTGSGIAGATLDIGALNTTSSATGAFSMGNVDLAQGNVLAASKSGYLARTLTVSAPTGAKSVSVGDISLQPSTSAPVVESLQLRDPKGVYVRGLPSDARALLSRPTAEATVNWNGNAPGTVEFRADGALVGSVSGSGPTYALAIPIDDHFPGSIISHKVSATARPGGGAQASESLDVRAHVISLPGFLRNLLGYVATGPGSLSIDWTLLSHEQSVTLPVVGKYGCELSLGCSFDYTFEDGSWELGLGATDTATAQPGKRGRRPVRPGLTRYRKPKLYVGNKEIEASLYGVARGSSLYDPFVIGEFSVDTSLSWKGELTRYGLPDVIIPGISNALKIVPGADAFLKDFSIILWLKVGGDGSVVFGPTWPPDFREVTLAGTLGLEASYEPSISKNLHGKIYVGGEGTLEVGMPDPIFREAGFKLYGGVQVTAWVLEFEREWVVLEYTWSPSRRLALDVGGDPDDGHVIEAAGNRTATWRAMERPWRDVGCELFLLGPTGPERRLDAGAQAALELFARMGRAPSPGAVFVPASGPDRRIASDPALPAQAELPLLQNVFPQSEPALAGSGDNLMLLYVRDTGAANPVQFTEIAYTRFDGTSWSAPAPLASDARGQFAPAVAFDGTGAAVAVWERMKDPAFEGEDIEEMAAQMEIVSARCDPATGVWGAPEALTDNAFLDHRPRLAGPMADGDLMLTYHRNEANLIVGAGAPGAPENTRILTRRWNAATRGWGPEETLFADLAGELSDSLAAAGSKAACMISRDLDGNFDDSGDAELFYRIWDEAAGAWGPATRHTTDAVPDRNARVALDAAGGVYCMWQRGEELVMDRDFAGAPSAVRPDAATAGFSDFTLTVGPGGNVLAVWQEMTDFGSDAHYRVFDPASNTWGLDTPLSGDADVERSFAAVWDPMANLVLAYDNVAVTKQTMTVATEEGGTLEVPGVPQPGQVDLCLAKRALVKDLGFAADGLRAEGTTFLPGDAVTLRARVRNTGNVAVRDVRVGFYDGDPSAGGTLIETVTLPGWLKASDEAEASASWTIPEPALERTVHAVVDPGGLVTEFDEANNRQSLGLNGVDLDLAYVSGAASRDGSARVVARVKNIGAPGSRVANLRLKLRDGTAALAEVAVSQLEPGESVEVPLDLPAETQAEGATAYRLALDEEGATGDIDTDNNGVQFTLSLWIDDDGDGVPRSYEEANGMSDVLAGDALLDVDGDAFDGRQEYLAGTDPRDAASHLKPGEFNVVEGGEGGGSTCTISWASVAGRIYRVERSFDMAGWETVADDIAATPPLNSVSEDVVLPAGRVFYRIVAK